MRTKPNRPEPLSSDDFGTGPGPLLVTRHGPVDMRGRTAVMGILNVTPDSFFDGGRYPDIESAVARGVEMVRQGASIVDVGGESTRPGAAEVPAADELDRVLPVIRGLRQRVAVPISIDTYKSEVARKALDAGADMVNDISALRFDPAMAGLVGARERAGGAHAYAGPASDDAARAALRRRGARGHPVPAGARRPCSGKRRRPRADRGGSGYRLRQESGSQPGVVAAPAHARVLGAAGAGWACPASRFSADWRNPRDRRIRRRERTAGWPGALPGRPRRSWPGPTWCESTTCWRPAGPRAWRMPSVAPAQAPASRVLPADFPEGSP